MSIIFGMQHHELTLK